MGNHYQDKIANNISRQLAIILQQEVKDPRVGFVTIADIELSKDLSVAKIFITVINKDKIEVAKLLNKISGFLRTKLAAKINMKNTPELRFFADTVSETSENIEKILSDIHTKK